MILFGATGMVGQGVLRECLLDRRVDKVLAIGRVTTGAAHGKLTEIVLPDLTELAGVADRLDGYDTCLFCLGVSSAGMGADAYRRVTYDLTLSVARVLARRSPGCTFLYVSGQGTDGTERGRVRWARVKGETENALRALPGLRSYALRPGFIQPLHGATSKTPLYAAAYRVVGPLFPLLRRVAPAWVTSTETLARAMLAVAEHGYHTPVLETRDINEAARLHAG